MRMQFASVMRHFRRIALAAGLAACAGDARAEPVSLGALDSPVLFRGDATTAYRDPAAVYVDGWFHLFFTLVKVEGDGKPYSFVAWSKSRDLLSWSPPQVFTPRDRRLNYGSPGSLVRVGGEWLLCLQTYPRPNGERYGNADSRLWTMRSRDLEAWGEPELMRVKGPGVPQERMGRMIDPCLVEDAADPGAWWCFYKTGAARSRDLRTWTPEPQRPPGENPCVIRDGAEYVMAYAPANGVGLRRSADLRVWREEGVLTLGQQAWPWARGRLTGGFLLDLRRDPAVGKVLLFFHGSDFPEEDPRGGFDTFASVGVAWSDDLKTWRWPQREKTWK
jgi:hypothetical protein